VSPIKLVLEAPELETLDLRGLDTEIANVSEGFPRQGNVALEAPRLEKLRFDRFR
jgi:hypothetical protein